MSRYFAAYDEKEIQNRKQAVARVYGRLSRQNWQCVLQRGSIVPGTAGFSNLIVVEFYHENLGAKKWKVLVGDHPGCKKYSVIEVALLTGGVELLKKTDWPDV